VTVARLQEDLKTNENLKQQPKQEASDENHCDFIVAVIKNAAEKANGAAFAKKVHCGIVKKPLSLIALVLGIKKGGVNMITIVMAAGVVAGALCGAPVALQLAYAAVTLLFHFVDLRKLMSETQMAIGQKLRAQLDASHALSSVLSARAKSLTPSRF
jgi:hypothetical protein